MILCEQCKSHEAVYMDPEAALWCQRCYARLPPDQGVSYVHMTFLIQSLWGLPAAVTQEMEPAAWVRAAPWLRPIVERVLSLYPERCPPAGHRQ